MCGRFGLTEPPWQIAKRLNAKFDDRLPFVPQFNVAPTQQVYAITNDGARSLTTLRWGLIPPWASSPTEMKLSTFNARVETIATARTYRGPTREKRCIVLADGFYEWRKNTNGSKTPLWIYRERLLTLRLCQPVGNLAVERSGNREVHDRDDRSE